MTPGTVRRTSGDLTVTFTLNDLQHSLDVRHAGILPDLFREGQGIIAHGRLDETGVFVAHIVLAKHDENYDLRYPQFANSGSPLQKSTSHWATGGWWLFSVVCRSQSVLMYETHQYTCVARIDDCRCWHEVEIRTRQDN